MWRKLTVMLFLMILAQAANASAIAKVNSHSFEKNSIKQLSITLSEQLLASSADNDESEDLFNLPRLTRISPSIFSAEVQTTANYVLVIEFFKSKLNAAMFKLLSNPPEVSLWFEQLSHSSNSSRLSGWKDGNLLYSARTTYHS